MVIETDLSYNSGSFIVKKYAIDDVLTARTNCGNEAAHEKRTKTHLSR
jgi:hypothetical protein